MSIQNIFINFLTVSMLLIVNNLGHSAEWAYTFGGSSFDNALSFQQTSDGGYIVAGYTASFGAGSYDIWLLKLDMNGGISWQKTYGGSDYDEAYAIQQTNDDGYIVAGYTASFGTSGSDDIWVLKLDSSGDIIWQKTYGGGSYDNAYAIQQTSDGGYIVAGYTASFGAGEKDIWVLKLTSSGDVIWQKAYGGSGNDEAQSILQTSDGGYILAGSSWVLKLNSIGGIIWQKNYGESTAFSIRETSDSGYIVTGTTYSFGAGYFDSWVLKLDSNGDVIWQKAYGGSDNDGAYSIQQTSDNGYIVAGTTASFGVGGSDDIWLIKLDSSGGLRWQKTYGGNRAFSVRQVNDGGYIVAGYTNFSGFGMWDVNVFKLDVSGDITGCESIIHTSNGQESNSSFSGDNTDISVQTTALISGNTSILPEDSPSAVEQICGQAIPTLSEWGMIIFMTMILGIGVVTILRRRMI